MRTTERLNTSPTRCENAEGRSGFGATIFSVGADKGHMGEASDSLATPGRLVARTLQDRPKSGRRFCRSVPTRSN